MTSTTVTPCSPRSRKSRDAAASMAWWLASACAFDTRGIRPSIDDHHHNSIYDLCHLFSVGLSNRSLLFRVGASFATEARFRCGHPSPTRKIHASGPGPSRASMRSRGGHLPISLTGKQAKMSIARRFTERVATASVSLIATALVTGGVTLAGMGATLRQTASDITGMTVITSGLMVMGAVLAITGAIGGIANWKVSRDSGAPADVSSGHLIALVGAAAVLPVILAVLLTPLIAYWRDLIRLADQYDVL